jgi:hypothetical protein
VTDPPIPKVEPLPRHTTPSWLDLLFWVGFAALAAWYGGCTLWG